MEIDIGSGSHPSSAIWVPIQLSLSLKTSDYSTESAAPTHIGRGAFSLLVEPRRHPDGSRVRQEMSGL